ncbi:hypothetical protein DFP73DRAFT_594217 [Morchella snyderi]|nr:hypothetical protein DFP73DRAFT_594217 [Morchella snyderi]
MADQPKTPSSLTVLRELPLVRIFGPTGATTESHMHGCPCGPRLRVRERTDYSKGSPATILDMSGVLFNLRISPIELLAGMDKISKLSKGKMGKDNKVYRPQKTSAGGKNSDLPSVAETVRRHLKARREDVSDMKSGIEPKGDFLNWLRKNEKSGRVTKPRMSKRGAKISYDRKLRNSTDSRNGMPIEDIDMVNAFRALDAQERDRTINHMDQSGLVDMMESFSLPEDVADEDEMSCESNNEVTPRPGSELPMDISDI